MKDILSEIIAHKQTEIELQKQTVSPEQLQEQAGIIIRENAAHRRSMKQALAASSTGIISEFKRRSPSKGWINEAARAEEIPAAYEAAGAATLSILTDEKFFGGTLRDIRTARPLVRIPILRKDFIIDEYQLLQACIVGADAVLLIASCLSPEQCSTLTTQAHELGLEVLLEIHSPSELSYINKEVDMVGVNNRNLGSSSPMWRTPSG
jgi:indole-3-glycerol phosphate synthase